MSITLKGHAGRKYHGKTYKMIQAYDRRGGVRLHKVLAERALGRSLRQPELVHHLEKGRKDGGQLVVCPNDAYHVLLHYRQRAYEATGDAHKVWCSFCQSWDNPEGMIRRKGTVNGVWWHRRQNGKCIKAIHS